MQALVLCVLLVGQFPQAKLNDTWELGAITEQIVFDKQYNAVRLTVPGAEIDDNKSVISMRNRGLVITKKECQSFRLSFEWMWDGQLRPNHDDNLSVVLDTNGDQRDWMDWCEAREGIAIRFVPILENVRIEAFQGEGPTHVPGLSSPFPNLPQNPIEVARSVPGLRFISVPRQKTRIEIEVVPKLEQGEIAKYVTATIDGVVFLKNLRVCQAELKRQYLQELGVAPKPKKVVKKIGQRFEVKVNAKTKKKLEKIVNNRVAIYNREFVTQLRDVGVKTSQLTNVKIEALPVPQEVAARLAAKN